MGDHDPDELLHDGDQIKYLYLVLTFQPAGQLACLTTITTGVYTDNLAHKTEIIHTNCRPHSNEQNSQQIC